MEFSFNDPFFKDFDKEFSTFHKKFFDNHLNPKNYDEFSKEISKEFDKMD